MLPQTENVLKFAQEIDRCSSMNELKDAAGAIATDFGARHFGIQVAFSATGAPEGRHLFGRIDPSWPRRYLRRDFVRKDAAIQMLHTTLRPYTWAQALEHFPSTSAEMVMSDARAGLGSDVGLVVPIHEIGGEVLTAAFCGPDLQIGPEAKPALHLLGSYFALRGRELERGATRRPAITPRQTDCLKWVSEGKTDEEIGLILGISHTTVHNHIEAAKRALGVRSRAQAAVLAWRSGWIA